MEPWTFDRLTQLISDGIEESLSLDYKAAGALKRDDKKRIEITKDVSAMANSAGGAIVYGIREHQEEAKRHLPESIDPIKRQETSKEWLEQVIQNIRPRVEGVVIHPVPTPADAEGVVYVVEIPQSSTAHQAMDLRYYRRFNFESVPMQDYEIRDVMARKQHPVIEIEFHILFTTGYISGGLAGIAGNTRRAVDIVSLCAVAENKGRRVANYVSASFFLPIGIVNSRRVSLGESGNVEGVEYHIYQEKNLVRDITGYVMEVPKYGECRYEPILPDLTLRLGVWELDAQGFKGKRAAGSLIYWQVSADEAPKRFGKTALSELRVVDKREKSAAE